MMDVFDLFFKKYSYKFPKGYPDINNEQDILLLENILDEMGLHELFKNLSFYDLSKRGGGRFKIVYDKIKQGLPFNINNGESTPLMFDKPEYEEAFANADISTIKQISPRNINVFPFFKDDANNKYSFSDLLKDKDFGGKGAGSGTKVEDYNLKLLNDEIQRLITENGGNPINVVVDGVEYPDIIEAKTQSGYPKADFNLVDSKGEPVVFISHKKSGGKGASANDFIRWSGYTEYANHPEVEQFNNALKQIIDENPEWDGGLPRATRFIAPIQDEELIRKLIYGPKYGESNKGKDNVTCIMQGKISLVSLGNNKYKLISEHSLFPPQIPQDDYYPYFTSSYRSDRAMFGIKNNEAIVMTEKVATAASNIYSLERGKFVKIK